MAEIRYRLGIFGTIRRGWTWEEKRRLVLDIITVLIGAPIFAALLWIILELAV